MKKLSVSESKKSIKRLEIILSAAILLILICSVISVIILNQKPKGAGTATIYMDGEVYQIIDLKKAADQIILLESVNAPGTYNKVEIKDGDIRVIEADCPGQLCVKQGFASESRIPIVCLPHNISIVVTYDIDEEEYDVITY